MKKVTAERKELLNLGQVETTNLMESLSIDFKVLLGNVLPKFKFPELEHAGITKKYKQIAHELNIQLGFSIFDALISHKSDSIRSLGCYLLGIQDVSFSEKLKLILPLANDNNSGVREWAWIAIRQDFASNIEESLVLLEPLTFDKSANVRRFASELSRPRGVWCQHIAKLRQEPWLGLSILSPLKSDPAIYVQLSVGNWLNDAGKDHPEWVVNLCHEWQKTYPTKETTKICRRALRNLI